MAPALQKIINRTYREMSNARAEKEIIDDRRGIVQCAACGQFVTVMKAITLHSPEHKELKYYHPECAHCVECGENLG
jgi:hypothetical protein